MLDWAAREIIELCGSPLELITVQDAIWLAETPAHVLPPELRSRLREAHFAALVFDGPRHAGHFYLLIHRGFKSPLVVFESHPTVNGAHRRATRAFRNILGAPSVETHTIFGGHDADCGMQTARHLSYALAGKTFFSSRQDFVEWADSRLQARRTDGGSAFRGVSFSSADTNKVVYIPGRACRTYAHGGFFPDPVPVYEALLYEVSNNHDGILTNPDSAKRFCERWGQKIDLSSDTLEGLPAKHPLRGVTEVLAAIRTVANRAFPPDAPPDGTHQVPQSGAHSATPNDVRSKPRRAVCTHCSFVRCRCTRLLHENTIGVKSKPRQTAFPTLSQKPQPTTTPRDMLKALIGVMCLDSAIDGALVNEYAPKSLFGGGLSRKDFCETVLHHAPRMTSKDIVAALADAEVGSNVVMTWRFTAELAGATRTRTWVGEIIKKVGTERSPSWRIRWDSTPVGEFDDEDGERVAHPVSSLPAPFLNDGGDNTWQIDVLAVHTLGPADGGLNQAAPPFASLRDRNPDLTAQRLDESRGRRDLSAALDFLAPSTDLSDDEEHTPTDTSEGVLSDASSSTPASSTSASDDEDVAEEEPLPATRAAVPSTPSLPKRSNNEIALGILSRNAKVDHVGNYAPIGSAEQPVLNQHWPSAPSSEPDASVGVSRYSGRAVLEPLMNLDPVARQSVVPTIVWSSLSSNTIADHFRELRRFKDYLVGLPDDKLDLPVDVLLAHHFQREWASTDRRTMWTTMATRMRSIVGAFSMLPVYAPTTIMVRPNKYPVFSAMMTTANRKAVEQPGRQPVPATFADVKRALDFLPSDRLKWLLITSWFTSSRPTIDTVYIEKKDFVC